MKKKRILILLVQCICATGLSQGLSLQTLGQPFKSPNLLVCWDAPTNVLPSTVWSYRLLPRTFSARAISNLVAACGLSEDDESISNADAVVFKNADKNPTRFLGISSSRGAIYYQSVNNYGPTNLAKDVPAMGEMPKLTTNFLSEFGINTADIEKRTNGTPRFRFWEPSTEYFVSNEIITNIEFRAVNFRRSVDGANVLGAGTAGNGQIEFGPHGRPVGIDLTWPNLERHKSFRTVTTETIIRWIREGKAVQGGIALNLPDIDWMTAKRLTVKKAEICYYAGNHLSPSLWLMPLVSLWTTVDTGNGMVNVEIDCPITDETKQ